MLPKLFKGRNYSRAETIRGNTVFIIILPFLKFSFSEKATKICAICFCFDIYLVNVKTIRRMAQSFEDFSEKLNFNSGWKVEGQWFCFFWGCEQIESTFWDKTTFKDSTSEDKIRCLNNLCKQKGLQAIAIRDIKLTSLEAAIHKYRNRIKVNFYVT